MKAKLLGVGLVLLIVLLGVTNYQLKLWPTVARKQQSASVPILMYHKVSPDPRIGGLGLRVNPRHFEKQVGLLAKMGYRTVSMDYLITRLQTGTALPDKVLVITFDDGYRDNFLWARPILKKYGFRALIFLVSEQIGKTNAWDNGMPINKLLSEKEINLMLVEGFEFGSHTQTHRSLTTLKQSKAAAEISDSKTSLEKKLGTTIKYFCYPYGKYNQQVVDLVKVSGYDAAFTTVQGKIQSGNNIFTLKRIRITGHSNLSDFIKLLGLKEKPVSL